MIGRAAILFQHVRKMKRRSAHGLGVAQQGGEFLGGDPGVHFSHHVGELLTIHFAFEREERIECTLPTFAIFGERFDLEYDTWVFCFCSSGTRRGRRDGRGGGGKLSCFWGKHAHTRDFRLTY